MRAAVGFVGAWLEVMGLELALLFSFVAIIRYLTRRRPGRPSPTGGRRPPHPAAYDDACAAGGDFG